MRESNKNTIKWIMQNSKKQFPKICILVISNAFFSILSVVFALAVKKIIDGATNNNRDELLWGSIGICIIVIFQFAFRIIINGLAEHIKAKLENEYRLKSFSTILTRKYDKITAYHSGELMNRLTSDVTVVADAVTDILPALVSSIVRLGCAIGVLAYLDWVFAIAFVIGGLLVCVVLTALRGKLKSLHTEVQKTSGKMRSFMQECIENLLGIKVFAVNEKINGKAEELTDKNFKVRMRRKSYSVTGHATFNMIFSAGYIFALIFGASKIYGATMSYGALMAILQLVNNVQVPFATISSVFPKYYAMLASTERIMEIENIASEIIDENFDDVKTYNDLKSISFEDVCFSYGRDKVLENANLTINKGEFVALTGGSGEGKSTLIKLLLGVYPVNDGEIRFNLENQKVLAGSETRKLFSYVPQQNLLFSGSIRENLTFINSNATEEEIANALKISCCDEFIYGLSNGLDTTIGEEGLGLSQGQIQRVAIARAIISKSPVMVLDESTSALDEKTEKQFLENLRQLKGRTIIMISHKKAVFNVCDKVICVKNKQAVDVKN